MKNLGEVILGLFLSLFVLFIAAIFISWGAMGLKERRIRYKSYNPQIRLSWTFRGKAAIVVSWLVLLCGLALGISFLFVMGETLLSLW